MILCSCDSKQDGFLPGALAESFDSFDRCMHASLFALHFVSRAMNATAGHTKTDGAEDLQSESSSATECAGSNSYSDAIYAESIVTNERSDRKRQIVTNERSDRKRQRFSCEDRVRTLVDKLLQTDAWFLERWQTSGYTIEKITLLMYDHMLLMASALDTDSSSLSFTMTPAELQRIEEELDIVLRSVSVIELSQLALAGALANNGDTIRDC